NAGMTFQQVATGFMNSTEHRWDQVAYYYQDFLNRAPDTLAQFWVDGLQAGAGEPAVVQGIIASPEYQSQHATDTSYVGALYLQVLGRQGTAEELAFWDAVLASGMSRAGVASGFVHAPESQGRAVVGDYASY